VSADTGCLEAFVLDHTRDGVLVDYTRDGVIIHSISAVVQLHGLYELYNGSRQKWRDKFSSVGSIVSG